MKYEREPAKQDVDVLYLDEQEMEERNRIFRSALKRKYPNINVGNINVTTAIYTDELYRVEFKIKPARENHQS